MVNTEIKAEKVRLITNGKAEEILTSDALRLAEEQELDLILVADGDVPVVKIYDYNKFLYEKKKKDKERDKKQKANIHITKEIQLGDSIAEHDMSIKARKITELLHDGNNVKISITYRGRNIAYIDSGIDKIKHLLVMIEASYKMIKDIKIDGNKVSATIGPNK